MALDGSTRSRASSPASPPLIPPIPHSLLSMDKARKLGMLKKFQVGRCSEATVSDAFKKQSSILRYLGGIDPSGQNIQLSHKQDAMKHCGCTMSEVEHILAKYTWAKEAQQKIENLQKEGKPIPKSFNEVQKLMGSTPLDVARSNLAKNGQISRNALCPCKSGKKYKRCCGMT
ncbi:protein translocase subunit SecA 1 isoform X2 [Dioscorea cayenensis subsp. rotundata]|uniref:Protein translocase subunit SecA 1 isoform X2 n=1 Tax=Dioscorea cayennensis subsp. rotundata TaxID=55577 RepID=A0AB40D0B0_DIOCR|nr:protein translocase subunit SecA 1 isoform X2 [Dioscorea cayenensis subsp. rotundata]